MGACFSVLHASWAVDHCATSAVVSAWTSTVNRFLFKLNVRANWVNGTADEAASLLQPSMRRALRVVAHRRVLQWVRASACLDKDLALPGTAGTVPILLCVGMDLDCMTVYTST
jgi:hypothetical protein